ncbi:MAG: flagellar hook-basal body complex protein [Lachnospiraceae bacterium]|nr:flagellar hook-basal body complex protein [Lachnospiraceae bacterium]
MMRSLFAGVAGLKTHQTKMDVIGNNIANVNTVAYKSQSATFSDLMYQTTQRASGPNAETGTAGTNAKQIGLGVKMGAIKTAITTEGAAQTTGDPFDVKITGESFFIVNGGGQNVFTRDGSFYVDAAGNLAMASNGYNVMGWLPDTQNPTTIKKDTVQALRVMSPEAMQYDPKATEAGTLSGILDRNDPNVATTDGRVLSLQFYDNKGYSYTMKFAMKEIIDANTGAVDPGKYTLDLTQVLDSEGNAVADNAGFELNQTTITFDLDSGKVTDVKNADTDTFESDKTTGVFNFTVTNKTATADGGTEGFRNIKIDVGSVLWWDNGGTSTIGMEKGDPDGLNAGRKVGNLSGISIQDDGMIYASYDNGQRRLLGQIAVAKFANASGLEKAGDNLYKQTLNSGEFDGIGVTVDSDGEGYFSTGVLEMSNVDLSSEFTEMITTQRGFQANSRIITVSDTLLEELTNLKR